MEIIKADVFVRENPALVNNDVSILVPVTPRGTEDNGEIWTSLVVKFSRCTFDEPSLEK